MEQDEKHKSREMKEGYIEGSRLGILKFGNSVRDCQREKKISRED